MSRLLVTGANGFIGSALVERALAQGWEVTAAVRPTSDCSHLQGKRVRFVHLPYASVAELRQVLRRQGRFDYVAHIAGVTKALRREVFFHINAHYTRSLAEALTEEELRPVRFLLLSSLAALGPATGSERVHPSQPAAPVTTYGASKRAAEEYVEALGSELPWVIVQPTAVFGPRDRDLFQFVRLVNRGLELYIGLRPQRVSFIHVDDLAELMLTALARGPQGKKFIAADGHDYTTDDLGEAVRLALCRRTLRLRLPLAAAQAVATISEQVGKWRGRIPALYREKLRELYGVNWWCDTSETFQALNFQPQYNLYSGMKDTVNWYRQHEWL